MTDLENLKRILNGENVLDVQEDPNMSVGEPASFPEVEKAQVDAQNAQINEMAKSPNMKSKTELQADQMEQASDRTVAGQLQENTPVAPEEDPMLSRYKKAINDYESKLNAPDKEYGAMDALPDILAGLYNIGVRAKGGVLPEMKMPNSIGTAKAQESATRKDQLAGLKNIQDMYAKYMALQEKSKSKGLTELDKRKLDLQSRNLDIQEKRLEKDSNKPSDLSFREKEEIKLDAKMKAEAQKEDAKIRKENLKTKKEAEKSMSNFDEQLKKIKRAKSLLEKMVKNTSVADTGPLDQYVAGSTSEGQELRQAFNDLSLDKMSKLFQGMSKAVDSDAERKMFEQSQASLGNYPNVNMKILNDMEQGIVSLQNKTKDVVNRYDSKGNEQEISSSDTKPQVQKSETQEVRRQTKDGRIAIFDSKTKKFLRYE